MMNCFNFILFVFNYTYQHDELFQLHLLVFNYTYQHDELFHFVCIQLHIPTWWTVSTSCCLYSTTHTNIINCFILLVFNCTYQHDELYQLNFVCNQLHVPTWWTVSTSFCLYSTTHTNMMNCFNFILLVFNYTHQHDELFQLHFACIQLHTPTWWTVSTSFCLYSTTHTNMMNCFNFILLVFNYTHQHDELFQLHFACIQLHTPTWWTVSTSFCLYSTTHTNMMNCFNFILLVFNYTHQHDELFQLHFACIQLHTPTWWTVSTSFCLYSTTHTNMMNCFNFILLVFNYTHQHDELFQLHFACIQLHTPTWWTVSTSFCLYSTTHTNMMNCFNFILLVFNYTHQHDELFQLHFFSIQLHTPTWWTVSTSFCL